jgi:hypothetical protein
MPNQGWTKNSSVRVEKERRGKLQIRAVREHLTLSGLFWVNEQKRKSAISAFGLGNFGKKNRDKKAKKRVEM